MSIVVATIVKSSSNAVSAITVDFVNAGLLNLTRAIGFLMGINGRMDKKISIARAIPSTCETVFRLIMRITQDDRP